MQDQARCDAKIEKVSQRIQFLTYARSRVKRTRKTAIKAIKNHGDHKCNYRHVDSTISAKRTDVRPANRAQRHKVGQRQRHTALVRPDHGQVVRSLGNPKVTAVGLCVLKRFYRYGFLTRQTAGPTPFGR